jgi:hypothetical protein
MTWTTDHRTNTTMAAIAEALAGFGGVPSSPGAADRVQLPFFGTPRRWSSRHPNATAWQHHHRFRPGLLPHRLPGIQPHRGALRGSATTPTRTRSGHRHGTIRIGSELEVLLGLGASPRRADLVRRSPRRTRSMVRRCDRTPNRSATCSPRPGPRPGVGANEVHDLRVQLDRAAPLVHEPRHPRLIERRHHQIERCRANNRVLQQLPIQAHPRPDALAASRTSPAACRRPKRKLTRR